MSESKPKPSDAAGRKPGKRRPYKSPRLTEYGSVAKLTQGTATLQQDSPAGTSWKKTACL